MSATYTDRLRGVATSVAIKAPVRVATTANITLSGTQVIDDILVAVGDRVLVKNQTTTTENGIWNVSTGAWTRALDFNGARDVVKGTQVYVTTGTLSAGVIYGLSTTDPVIGSTAIAFTQTSELGLIIGTNVQAYSAKLASLAAVGAESAGRVVAVSDGGAGYEFLEPFITVTAADDLNDIDDGTAAWATGAVPSNAPFAGYGHVSQITVGTRKTQLAWSGEDTATRTFSGTWSAWLVGKVSPTFTGTPTAPTAAAGTNTTQLATTAYTRTAIPNVLNASGSAPVYACRAWVNFNGSGTVAIRAGGNVSSITDNGVGQYTVNFTTAMPDVNYAATVTGESDTTGATANVIPFIDRNADVYTVSAVAIRFVSSGATSLDVRNGCVAVFR